MAAQPVLDVFEVERRRLEKAAADLRKSLAERDEQLSEQCAKCAQEEEKLLRSKYFSELKENAASVDQLRARVEKNAADLENRETDLRCAEERMEAIEEYQSHLRQEEGTRRDLHERIGQLKAKHRTSAENLKSQMCKVEEGGHTEEVKLHQQLRLREEGIARNEEACASMNGMTLQEHLAADLKTQLAESQDKVASLEVSVESMQALVLEREVKVSEMIQNCDSAKEKACVKDFQHSKRSDFIHREDRLQEASLQIERLEEADLVAAKSLAKLQESGGLATAKVMFRLNSISLYIVTIVSSIHHSLPDNRSC